MAETFICSNPDCREEYGDPLYHGPDGHAPPTLCYTCWVNEWAGIEDAIRASWSGRRPKTPRDKAEVTMLLFSAGLNRQQVARRLKIHRSTLWRWIQNMRRNPHLIPEWWIKWAMSGGE